MMTGRVDSISLVLVIWCRRSILSEQAGRHDVVSPLVSRKPCDAIMECKQFSGHRRPFRSTKQASIDTQESSLAPGRVTFAEVAFSIFLTCLNWGIAVNIASELLQDRATVARPSIPSLFIFFVVLELSEGLGKHT